MRVMKNNPVMKSPKSADIAITGRCNLRCKHCSHFSSPGDTNADLPLDEWKKFMDELGRLAVMSVTIEGGEPFCRDDLEEIIESAVANRMRFGVLTNGTLITDETAAFLASTGRCNSVQVSIDGSFPGTHDALRGEGNFEKAVEGIGHLRKNGVRVTVRVTINRYNVGELDRIADFLLVETGLSGFSTNSASHMGLCRSNADEIQLSAEDRSLAMEKLLELDKKYSGRISAAAGPLAELKHWTRMIKASRAGEKPASNQGKLSSCGGPLSKIAVRADGVMTPCLQMSHIELGRINEDPLGEIWQSHPELVRLRERRRVSLTEFEFCRDCEYVSYCMGNCPALAYNITGSDFRPSPDACLKQFLESGGKIPEKALEHN